MFAVADGRGGNELGALASSRAVDIMVQGFARVAEGASLASHMPRLVRDANAAVHDEALEPARRGRLLSTTLVSCALRNDGVVISYVGDSRCYLVRDRQALLLTRVDARTSDRLARHLGPEMFVPVETRSFPLLAGDVLVLCTDGLYEAMYPEDIARIAGQNREPGEVARELVSYAVQSDGSDNATAQVIRVRSTEAAIPAKARTAAAS